MLSPKSQGTRNPYDYEQTSASAELFWLTVTVGTGVHGKLKKPTATGRLPSVVFGTRFARRRRKILKILCTILKRTYIILDVQIALKMKKKRCERVEKRCIFSGAPDGAIKSFNPLVCGYFSPRSGEFFLGVFLLPVLKSF